MMEHDEIREKLTAFRDPEMPESQKREISEHLDSCAGCREIFSRWEQMSSAFHRAPMPEPSETFVNRVMERLEALEKPVPELSAGWKLPRWLVMSFGYTFGIFLMFIAITNRQTPVNAAVVLLSDLPSGEQWSFVQDQPDAGQILGLSKEDV